MAAAEGLGGCTDHRGGDREEERKYGDEGAAERGGWEESRAACSIPIGQDRGRDGGGGKETPLQGVTSARTP